MVFSKPQSIIKRESGKNTWKLNVCPQTPQENSPGVLLGTLAVPFSWLFKCFSNNCRILKTAEHRWQGKESPFPWSRGGWSTDTKLVAAPNKSSAVRFSMAFRGGPLGGNETLEKPLGLPLPLGLPGGLPLKFWKEKSNTTYTQVTLF